MKRWLVTFRYQDGSVAGEVYAAGKTATAAVVSSIRRRGSGYEPWVVTLTHTCEWSAREMPQEVSR